MSNEEKSGQNSASGASEKTSQGETFSAENNDSSLEALVQNEQELARRRLKEENGREPTQEEIDKWLSAQTEGY